MRLKPINKEVPNIPNEKSHIIKLIELFYTGKMRFEIGTDL